MIVWLALFVLLGSSTSSGGEAPCRDPDTIRRFAEFADPSLDYSRSGLNDAFGGHLEGLEECLKRWVEDGGERDGIPLGSRAMTRETRLHGDHKTAIHQRLHRSARYALAPSPPLRPQDH